MKKFCIQSIIMGIGIGMIITASFNFLWIGKNAASLTPEYQIEVGSNLEKSLEDFKKNIGSNKNNEEDGMQEEEMVENNSDQQKLEDSDVIEGESSTVRIIVSSGMNTNSIANLLWVEGLVAEPDDFINLAHEKNYTRKFIAGRKLIPMGSSIEEILEILIER